MIEWPKCHGPSKLAPFEELERLGIIERGDPDRQYVVLAHFKRHSRPSDNSIEEPDLVKREE